ncbi:hypothetical protein WJX84_011854 [Apatococcus fuscideae]|uniref:Enoyl reductase (ER) domain-containing protein n=1 Tax=Apatococcus fuscideae TaxID=2026836 RepID=A0AAW1SQT1_9CHLO
MQRLGRAFRTASRYSTAAPAESTAWHNPAAVLHRANDLRFEHHDLPEEIPRGYVRVGIRALGICASDLHYLHQGRIGKAIVDRPMVIGHETAGQVVALGPEVTGLEVGNRVALEPQVPCWHNIYPRAGRYNLDPGMKYFATPPVHGALARFVDHPAYQSFKLPDNLSFEEGAMVEPLSNGMQACRRGEVKPGKSIAILGAGPMGLNALACARAHGASRIVITDIRDDNLPLAERLGAWKALHTPMMSPAEAAQQLTSLLPPYGPDTVIDCVGHESTTQTAIEAVAPGGIVVQVGMGKDRANFPVLDVVFKELDFRGCFRYTNTYPICLELVSEGKIDVSSMITHRFGFSAEEIAAGISSGCLWKLSLINSNKALKSRASTLL